jgi:hypothetical protein
MGDLDAWLAALGIQPARPRGNSAIYVVGPSGAVIAIVDAPNDAATLAADFLKIRRRWRVAHAGRAAA